MDKKPTKNSFLIYDDYKQHFELLQTPEEVKELLFAIFDYHKDGILPALTPMSQMAFSFIKANMDRDLDSYKKICHRNQVNGSKGGRPAKPKKPSGLYGNPKNPNEPKKPDTGIDTDNDIDTGIDNETIPPIPPSTDGDKEKAYQMIEFSNAIQEVLIGWINYKKRNYKVIGWKSLKTQLKKAIDIHGEDRIIDRMQEAMGSTWEGINLSTIKKQPKVIKKEQDLGL